MAVLRISGVGVSHVGLVRSGNEDSGFLSAGCMLVADGVGGAAAGEVASATTAYVVAALALAGPDEEPVAALREGVRLAQQQIAAGVRRDPARAGMATTLTALRTDGERFALAHVGDSRGYLFRDGELTRITRDHTYVQRLIDEGSLTEEDVPYHPWRSVVMRSVNGTADRGRRRGRDRPGGRRPGAAGQRRPDRLGQPRRGSGRSWPSRTTTPPRRAWSTRRWRWAGATTSPACWPRSSESSAVGTLDLMLGAARDPRNVVDPAAVRMPHTA